jgi:hypothetical protein
VVTPNVEGEAGAVADDTSSESDDERPAAIPQGERAIVRIGETIEVKKPV